MNLLSLVWNIYMKIKQGTWLLWSEKMQLFIDLKVKHKVEHIEKYIAKWRESIDLEYLQKFWFLVWVILRSNHWKMQITSFQCLAVEAMIFYAKREDINILWIF